MPSTSEPPVDQTGLDVRPFRALVYREHGPDQLARVSSPAYDLVTAAGRDRLAAADPHNIVRLILPHVEPTPGSPVPEDPTAEDLTAEDLTAGDPARGASASTAATTLRSWLAGEVLERDLVPAFWRYEMARPGVPATTGWLAAVGLPPPGSTAVLPHEDTFAPAVEGRRALLDATATDLEPIVLAHDPDPAVLAETQRTGSGPPTLEVADPDGVVHRLWRVTDPATLARLTTAFGGTHAVIADGHHRFAAAREHQLRGGHDDEAVLALLTPMGAGGLRLQAIHRVLPDLDLTEAAGRAARGFTVRELQPDREGLPALVEEWLTGAERPALLLTDGVRAVELTAPTADVLAAVPAEAPPAWRRLDVVLAHHGLVGHLLGRADDPASVLVAHDLPEALRLAAERSGVAVLLRSPSPADVAAVARAGARMPRKSTLFVPKPRTGLVLRPHDGEPGQPD